MSKRSDDPRRDNPFVNAEMKRYIKIKKRKWQAYKFSRTDENFNTYKIARNTVTVKLRQAQYEYEQNLAAQIKIDNNPAGTWRKYNVASTSMQRHDVASTLRRRCIYVMCLPGSSSGNM